MVTDNKYLDEMSTLKAEKLRLYLELDKLDNLKEENAKLKSMLGVKKEKKIELEALNVIAIAPSHFRRIILVDGGSEYGLRENMFVLDERGFLMGKILRVYGDYSEVILINDPQFSATVKIGENLGLLKGTLEGMLKVFYIEDEEEIKKDDQVRAVSFQSGSNFLVGEVIKVRQDLNSLSLDITVDPYSKYIPPKTIFVVK